jgi:hypothetical protein
LAGEIQQGGQEEERGTKMQRSTGPAKDEEARLLTAGGLQRYNNVGGASSSSSSNSSDESGGLHAGFPRVTLSWESLRYSIPTPAPLHHRLTRWRSSAGGAAATAGPPGLDATYSGADVERGGHHHHPASAHEKQLLRGVEGIVHPGELCAIMGASGTFPFMTMSLHPDLSTTSLARLSDRERRIFGQ